MALLPDDSTDLGTDVTLVTDLAPVWGLSSGKVNLGNALARRFSTPRGGLFYDLTYGTDVRAWLNEGITPANIPEKAAALAAEARKDPRIASASAVLTFNLATSTLTIAVALLTDDGPFDLVLAATAVSVELLSVDGIQLGTPPLTADQTFFRRGDQGPPGPQGPSGGGGTGSVDLDFAPEGARGVSSGAEEVVFERLCDFDPLAGGLTVEMTAQILSASGTSTFRLRVGGTARTADGTIALTMTTPSPTYVSSGASAGLSNPTGRQFVKLTAQNAVATFDARIRDAVVTIR